MPRRSQRAIDDAVLAFGGLDLVVNNAGLSLSKPLLETTEADWDLQHDVMAKGSFLVSKAAARVLIDQGLGGDIIYISSKNSVFAGPNNIAYSATKADQAHQVRLLAVELGEYGIKVNGINPDGVVRGSGIFAARLGRQPRQDLRHRGGGPRQVLRPAHDPQARGAARERRQRGDRAHRAGPLAHDRPAHPGRRGRRGRLPAMSRAGTSAARSPPSTSARRAAASSSATSTHDRHARARPRRALPERPGAHASTACTGTSPGSTATSSAGLADGVPARAAARVDRHRLVGGRLRRCCAATACSASRSTTATSATTRGVEACTRSCRSTSSTAATACSSCRSTPCTSSPPTATRGGCLDLADSLLLVPDLLGFWLTGAPRRRAHQRLDDRAARRRDRRVGRRAHRAARPPGIRLRAARRARATSLGALRAAVAAELGAPAASRSIAVGSHDTASAVVAVPMRRRVDAAYISCGTWGARRASSSSTRC